MVSACSVPVDVGRDRFIMGLPAMVPSRRTRLIELAERIDQLRAQLHAAEAEMKLLMEGRHRNPSSATVKITPKDDRED